MMQAQKLSVQVQMQAQEYTTTLESCSDTDMSAYVATDSMQPAA